MKQLKEKSQPIRKKNNIYVKNKNNKETKQKHGKQLLKEVVVVAFV